LWVDGCDDVDCCIGYDKQVRSDAGLSMVGHLKIR
jgi:hypothetical protein